MTFSGLRPAPAYLYKYLLPTFEIYDGAAHIYAIQTPGGFVLIARLHPKLFTFL